MTLDFIGIAALITALSSWYFQLRKKREDDKEREERDEHDRRLRSEMIIIGEQIALLKNDNSKLVLLVNQLYIDYMNKTGEKPAINWEMFDQFLMVKHVTTPLGPLQVKE